MTVDIWESGVGELGAAVLRPSMWTTPIPELSDGNHRRAQLALAVAAWTGTLVVATHDRWLIEKWASRRLRLPTA